MLLFFENILINFLFKGYKLVSTGRADFCIYFDDEETLKTWGGEILRIAQEQKAALKGKRATF